MSRQCKTVSFDLEDAFERQLLEHASKEKFSRYVKRLIARDLPQAHSAPPTPILEAPDIKEPDKPVSDVASFL